MDMPRYRRMPAQAGFSLLETIAAILLLALAFGAVMHVAGEAMRVTSHARDLSRIGMWADATFEAAGREQRLRTGTRDGWYDKDHHWQLRVTPVEALAGYRDDLHLYRLDLDISWHDGPEERHAHFATQRVQDEPPPAPASTAAGPPPMDDA